MAAFINTNTASLNAQRNLSSSQSQLTTSLQRLSSGLRINSAKDDAAGLAIASRFTSQIRGTDQAVRNANDGISLAQTAEGSLGEITNNLQRVRELAVQASNSTNSASDRAAIDQEVQQRLSEIDRNASQTSFNGQKILDGSFGTANFQIGANVGETIQVDLSTSLRSNSIGKIATTQSAVFGASATGGAVTTGALSMGDFSVDTAAAVDASISVAPTSLNFGSGAVASSTITVDDSNIDFSTATVNAGKGFNDSVTVTDFDYSGAGNMAQFDVDGVGITLSGDYTNADGVAQEIEDQLNNAGGDYTVTNTAGNLKIENNASTTAVAITNPDTNAGTAGFATDAGDAGVVGTNASFSVGGHSITLNQDYTGDVAGMAAEIESQLQAQDAGYAVGVSGNELTITLAGNSSAAAVAIDDTGDADAIAAGIVDHAGDAGVAGSNAAFNVDGKAISLTANFANVAALAAEIDTQLGAGYTAVEDNGSVKISKDGDTGAALAITGADAQATLAGFSNAAVGTAGSAATTSTALTFKVDGTDVTMDGDYSGAGGLATFASDLGTKLGSGYTVAVSGSGVSITNNTNGSDAVAISASDANATAAGVANATGTAGVTSGSVALAEGEFTITAANGKAVDMQGNYDSVDDLADAINKNVSGVNATVSGGKLTLTSAQDMSLGGSAATGLMGFASETVTASNGTLADANTKTVEAALSTIQRIDSALNAVSELRSTFGAIQNRFESVISNLSSSSENLSAARSRIQDADFAQETAALTRGQILQQAGTAMLAQANGLPNGVLALLRG